MYICGKYIHVADTYVANVCIYVADICVANINMWQIHMWQMFMWHLYVANVFMWQRHMWQIYIGGWGAETNREIVSFRLCVRAQLHVRSQWISKVIYIPFPFSPRYFFPFPLGDLVFPFH